MRNPSTRDPAGQGGSSKDRAARQIADWLSLFIDPGTVVEVRAPQARWPGRKRTENAFKRFEAFHLLDAAQEALRYSGRAPGVYFTLNPVRPDLDARQAARDTDILCRRWLLIDCDPERPKDPPGDKSATVAEKAEARGLVLRIREELGAEGWPAPILADSGNGYHLLYRIDLPAADGGLVKAVLGALARRFDRDTVKVDTRVYNPSRICKLYGTEARKGANTPDRPHRMTRVLEVPTVLGSEVVREEMLRGVASWASPVPARARNAAIEPQRAPIAPSANGKHDGKAPNDWTPEQRAEAYLKTCAPAISGQNGHAKAFKAACKVGPGFDLPSEVAFRLLWEHYNPHCVPPWSEKELRHKVVSAYATETRRGWLLNAERKTKPKAGKGKPAEKSDGRAGPPPPSPASPPPIGRHFRPTTDLGNAERLVDRHGSDLHFCHPWNKWLVWDGKRWDLDRTGAARRRARATVRSIYTEAASEENDLRRKELVKWGTTSEKSDRIAALLHLAEAEEGIPILPEELNSDPWAFNCLNGTIDLKTGQLRPHWREDRITQLCPLDFDPAARCPLWLETLALFFHREDPGHQAELIAYWQRVCGYALAGVVRDHILPVAYGTGANGKSTILGALLDIFGPDYAMKAPPDLFMAKKTDAHPTERADLFGKRLVVAIETEAGRRLNETMIKELTGGDKVRARRMREDFWEYSPTHTLIMATNHKPVVRGTDHGIWRRLKLVPFSVTVDDLAADKSMPEKLRAEAAGILAWCVQGCLDWQRHGLETPAEVTEATAGYRAEQDVIGLFLEEHTVMTAAATVKASILYARYHEWAEAAGERPVSMRAFGTAIQEREIQRKNSDGVWYLGIGLKARDESF